MTYSDKLKDPRWQRKRLEVLQRDSFTCQKCLDTTKTLHVHHRYYLPNTDPWDYELKTLVTLCFECHEQESVLAEMVTSFVNSLKDMGFLNGDFELISDGSLLFCPAIQMTKTDIRDFFRFSDNEVFCQKFRNLVEQYKKERFSNPIDLQF